MADKPSRALVLYGDGLARFIGPGQNHIHSLASRALCGFLALPNSPPSENEDMRIVREFAEILDANGAYERSVAEGPCKDIQNKCLFPTLKERFMGLKAAIVTDNSTVKFFGGMVGCNVFSWNKISENGFITDSSHLAIELLKLLGFQDGKLLDTDSFELVFVHIGATSKMDGVKDIEFLNDLVGNFLEKIVLESYIGSRIHMSVIMSYGTIEGDEDLEFSFNNSRNKNESELSHLFPCQSYMTKSGKSRENIRQYCPMLVAQIQQAVTRVDAVELFAFRDFLENSGNLVIPVDRFLHEIAFKLWKAPKYGA